MNNELDENFCYDVWYDLYDVFNYKDINELIKQETSSMSIEKIGSLLISKIHYYIFTSIYFTGSVVFRFIDIINNFIDVYVKCYDLSDDFEFDENDIYQFPIERSEAEEVSKKILLAKSKIKGSDSIYIAGDDELSMNRTHKRCNLKFIN
ncbi:hypothetical protein HERIO_1350 [Hepatospora eriocheir]|uniref:Uncharacterized protein n=1 Tax=Hepatospora eriocheir TaxID=1081669 RepID=A0A1X0QAG6_9MICR|nr:hypothetical protein HERIO_1350 [Hepatospora eriocheir]